MASHSHRLPLRPLLALVFALALLGLPAVAAAQGQNSALAQERYYSSYGNSAGPTAAQSENSALAQERYYSSYGQSTGTPAATSSAPSDGPGWTIAAIGGVALLLAGVAFGAVGSRAVVRPRGAHA
jgi:hypothetical protein